MHVVVCFFFFFNDTATTEIYTLSLHDALPISIRLRRVRRVTKETKAQKLGRCGLFAGLSKKELAVLARVAEDIDRKSTRLNSSHANISYAVFCLKKKKTKPR